MQGGHLGELRDYEGANRVLGELLVFSHQSLQHHSASSLTPA